ncbi:MAG: hypothetical protein HOV79_08120 [Hamadaea sp.]|nr:hypothetical protein [Hamadaea sp.]
MSSFGEPAPAAVAAPRRTPGVVTTAAVIVFGIGVLGVINALLGLVTLGTTVDRFRTLARAAGVAPHRINEQVSQLRVQSVVTGVIALLLGLLLIALAYFLLKGRNAARITTWVLCGLGALCACCGGVGLIFLANLDNVTVEGDQQTQEQVEIARALSDALPGWQVATSGTVSVLQLLGYLTVAILLALPAANAFFRKATPQWQPPPYPTAQPPTT